MSEMVEMHGDGIQSAGAPLARLAYASVATMTPPANRRSPA